MEAVLIALGLAIAAVVVVGVVVGVVLVRRRARPMAQRPTVPTVPAATDAREREAGAALVRTDERIRLADDELGFAIADFGDDAEAEFAPALDRARQRLSEAFHLNQLLHDYVQDTPQQRREWADRILQLCASADAVLDEQHAALAARRSAAQRTPQRVEETLAAIAATRQAVPAARTTVDDLAARYSPEALSPIAANPEQAQQLLDFAERSVAVARSKLSAARDREADVAAQAAVETVGRALALLQAVDRFEVEAIQAEATLAAMIVESQAELADARALPEIARRGAVDAAAAELDRTLAQLPAPGAVADPIGSLSAVRRANTALDEAVAERTRSVERTARLREQLVTAIDDAERQIDTARQLLADYRAPIGPDARTRLAEAERELAGLTDERDPASALARARRASGFAAEAASLARADLAAAQRPAHHGRGNSAAMIGGVLGGLAIGGLLEGMGDLGDFFD